jgi:hypothetical protein
LVWKRSAKLSPVRVSTVVHALPSVEPSSVQSRGSRSGASLAEVSAYLMTSAGASRVYWAQLVGVSTSHLVAESPSLRLLWPSLLFGSALTVMAVTWPRRLPGIPTTTLPSTPPLPASASTVSVQVGCGSSVSNDERNEPGAAAAAAPPVVTAAAAVINVTDNRATPHRGRCMPSPSRGR